jgi:hypothetical protein
MEVASPFRVRALSAAAARGDCNRLYATAEWHGDGRQVTQHRARPSMEMASRSWHRARSGHIREPYRQGSAETDQILIGRAGKQ